MYEEIKYLVCGDRALLVEFGNEISIDIHNRIRRLLSLIDSEEIPGVLEVVPTYRSMLIYYDPVVTNISDLENSVKNLNKICVGETVDKARIIEVPTIYGEDYGPDLKSVATYTGMSVEEVIDVHSSVEYLIYMIGFSPGFPYLGGMSKRIAVPRLETPRTIIPAGSVGIAENQTGIYPKEGPGGWRIIGRTPLDLFQENRNPPTLFLPGDYIRFVRITRDDYSVISESVISGDYDVRMHVKGDTEQI